MSFSQRFNFAIFQPCENKPGSRGFVDGRVFFAGTINVFSIKVSLAKTLNFV